MVAQSVLDSNSELKRQVEASCNFGGCFVCLHKSLTPLTTSDIVGSLLLFITGVLAGASGIGGGGINVPLLMIVQGFLIEEAVPLSHSAHSLSFGLESLTIERQILSHD